MAHRKFRRYVFVLAATLAAGLLCSVGSAAWAATRVGPLTLSKLDPGCWRYPSPSGVWPVAPVNRVHPIRGGMNDVRDDTYALGLPHIGVDIQAPDRARVYAVTSGVLSGFTSIGTGPEHFMLAGRYQYWHVTPLLGSGAFVSRGQLIGRVLPRFRHVHLTEIVPGCGWIDPRRPGGVLYNGLNREHPTIGTISAFRADRTAYRPFPPTPSLAAGRRWTVVDDTGPTGDSSIPIMLNHLSGTVDFRAPVSDTPRFATTMFPQQPLMASGVRSYIARWGHPNVAVSRVVTAFDGVRLIPPARFFSVYAYGTRRVKFCFDARAGYCSASWVIHTAGRGLSTRTVADGRYLFCVQAVTITDVSARRCAPIRIQNHRRSSATSTPRSLGLALPANTRGPGIAPARYGLAATTTNAGNLVILGGYSRITGWLRTAERFSTARQRWTGLPPMPVARFAPAAAVGPSGGVYAIGGYTNTLGDTTRVDRLDPHTDRWRQVAPLGTPRRYLAAARTDGRIYAIGGYNSASGALAGVGAYLPGRNRWIPAAKLLLPTAGAAAAVGHDDRIYVFGGWDQTHGILGRTQIYNPQTNHWTLGANMPVHREAAAAVTANSGCIYVMGGDTTQFGSVTTLREVDVYHPTSNTWTRGAPLLLPRRSLAAASGPRNIFAIAGYNHSRGALASTELVSQQKGVC